MQEFVTWCPRAPCRKGYCQTGKGSWGPSFPYLGGSDFPTPVWSKFHCLFEFKIKGRIPFRLCVKVEHLIVALCSLCCYALVYRFALRYCAYVIVRRRYRVPLMLYDLGITISFGGYNCEIASYRVVWRIVARFIIICYSTLLSYLNIYVCYY